MKLLLDENLSRRLIPFLQHDYPGSSQVVLLGLEAAPSLDEGFRRAAAGELPHNSSHHPSNGR